MSSNFRLKRDRMTQRINHTRTIVLSEFRPPPPHILPNINFSTCSGRVRSNLCGTKHIVMAQRFMIRFRVRPTTTHPSSSLFAVSSPATFIYIQFKLGNYYVLVLLYFSCTGTTVAKPSKTFLVPISCT